MGSGNALCRPVSSHERGSDRCVCYHIWLYMGTEDSNKGTHACVANTISIDPSSHSPLDGFLFVWQANQRPFRSSIISSQCMYSYIIQYFLPHQEFRILLLVSVCMSVWWSSLPCMGYELHFSYYSFIPHLFESCSSLCISSCYICVSCSLSQNCGFQFARSTG